MEQLLNFLSNLPDWVMEIIAILSFFIVVFIFYLLRKLFLGLKKITVKKENPQKMRKYWSNQRLLEYFKNSRRDPKKYGYTIFSGYP